MQLGAPACIVDVVQETEPAMMERNLAQGQATEVPEGSAYMRTESDLAREAPAADVIERSSRINEHGQQKATRTSLGMRSLGEVFDEAKREREEGRARGIPKGKRRLADVFDEAKRENEEARARGTPRRKQT